ncbi:myelin-oligodendrocyte glycoprotein-like isoform X2 [Toxotes jaculatrix]|uniref:myelin-oligodendrocyte glycoprotein-like isoform X2 n=1 Tax=Toxotes jaculatrix TaxID=941984 RepID=UPI001B3ABE45|nr:myelin-oligodendrocyte glycoprotein-like isoform X2 [Toxotes jaculatrix]
MNATLLALLSFFLSFSTASSVQTIKAKEGAKAILSCFLDHVNVSGLTVEWSKDGRKVMVHLYRHGEDRAYDQSEEFKNRTVLFHNGLNTGNVTLQISGLRTSDAGTYRLYIPRLKFYFYFKVDVEVPLYSTGRPPLEDMTKEPSLADPECKNRNLVRMLIVPSVFAVFLLIIGGLILRSRGTSRIEQEYELADPAGS